MRIEKRADSAAASRTTELRSLREQGIDNTMSIAIHHTAYDPADHRPAPRRYAWSVFAIIFALMVVDYVDRQVVVSMFPHLKAQWDLSDRQLGALVSIVSITVALGAVPLSFLADRWSRVKSIFLMAMVWSLATIGAAFAGSYAQLMGARSVVGLGEAAYGTVGMALLASLFPPRMRSTVLGAFLAAGMFGSVLGVMLGGFIAERWGWQAGFGAVGVPGLFLAVVFLLVVRDYKTVALPSRRRKRSEAAHDGARGDRRAPSAAHRARHVHRRRTEPARGFDDVRLAAELLQPLLRSRTGPGGPQDGHRRAGRRRRRSPLEHGCRSPERAHARGRGSSCRRSPRSLTTVFMMAAFAGFPPGPRSSP